MTTALTHVHDDAEIVQRPAAQPALLNLFAGGRGETAKALAAAVASVHGVEKHGENSFHKYKYAAADDVIAAGRTALASAGLALVPMEATLDHVAHGYELVRTFMLLHTSGECTPLKVVWPVVPDKGRPLDKATAAAVTTSLSYLLRDLLLMPRVDPADDMNAREDRPNRQQKPREPLIDRLKKKDAALCTAGLCKSGDLLRHLIAAGHDAGFGSVIEKWPEKEGMTLAVKEVKTFEEKCKKPRLSKKSLVFLQELMKSKRLSPVERERMLSSMKVQSFEMLSEDQAHVLIGELMQPEREPGEDDETDRY